MERKLGIMAECLEGVTPYDALDKIKEAGFEAFFTNEYRLKEVKKIKEKVREELKEHGIVHATLELENENERCHEKYCCIEFNGNHSYCHHHH